MDELTEMLERKMSEWKARLSKDGSWDRADCWAHEQIVRLLRQERNNEPNQH